MASIFISYRREDNPDAAGRIYDRLTRHFGDESVFFDIDTVPFGTDFRNYVELVVSKCDILLVIIGDRWLGDDDSGKSRLEDPADFVRIEIEAALRGDIPVIPVPVGNAKIPTPSELPEAISDLSYRNGAEVRSGTMFKGHITRLINGIDRILAETKRQTEKAAETKRQTEKAAETKHQTEKAAEAERQTEKAAEAEQPELVAGQVFKDGDDFPEMVVIPAGSFVMGGSRRNEKPQHRVTVPKFALGKYPVTFNEYDTFAHSTGRELPEDAGWGRGSRPVINVSWEDAQAYIDWLKLHTDKPYRLPSEAEWEYAARAGTKTRYWWGNDIRQDGKVWANCFESGSDWSGNKTSPVGKFPPNSFGLYDTAGNVGEWVEDCWHGHYENAPDDGSAWLAPDSGKFQRVIRGGSWGDPPEYLWPGDRSRNYRDYADFSVGFRLARDLAQGQAQPKQTGRGRAEEKAQRAEDKVKALFAKAETETFKVWDGKTPQSNPMLSELWGQVGDAVREALQDKTGNLAERCYMKQEYWINPQAYLAKYGTEDRESMRVVSLKSDIQDAFDSQRG